MKQTAFIAIGLAAILGAACSFETETHYYPEARKTSTLEQDFLDSVDDAQQTLADYQHASDRQHQRDDYYQRMVGSINQMSLLCDHMQQNCNTLGDECPTDGGATGDLVDQCMSGGHMMTPTGMGELRGDIAAFQLAIDDFWTQCGPNWGSACGQLATEHLQQTSDILDGMQLRYSGWWSSDDATDDTTGAMMDGPMMGGSMMDSSSRQWGSCEPQET